MTLRLGKGRWGVWLGFITFPCVSQEACIQLYGEIYHSFNQMLVQKAQLVVKNSLNQTLISIDTMKGIYQIKLPCHATTLTVHADGYRDLVIPLEEKYRPSKNAFYVPFPLIPIDRQTTDRPYFQAEQSHFELSPAQSPLQKSAKRVFRVIDALTHQVLDASICLFYTQTATQKCFNFKKSLLISFDQPDVIALEVNAPGYQTYKGNLLLTKLDDKTSDYTIRLVKDFIVFSLISSDTSHSYWLLKGTNTLSPLKRQDPRHHYCYLSTGSYQLFTGPNTEGLKSLGQINIQAGLNTYWVSNTTPVSAIENLSIAVPKKLHNYVLYFNQSDYALSDSANKILDTLAAWLVRQPDRKIQIIGHTDNVGNKHLNQLLSEFRAKVTFNYLFEKGVSPQQISWKGVGSQQPAAPNDTETQRRKNRRVDILLLIVSKT